MERLETSPGTWHQRAMVQLVRARLVEFFREPAAVFWVYGFPLIMVVALGMAFRNKPVERLSVDVEQAAGAEQLAETLRRDARFEVTVNSPADVRRRLRTGKVELVIVAGSSASAGYHFYYDPTRPNALLARNAADDLLQRAAGRQDVLPTQSHAVSEPGGRYIDFLVPGLLGMGLMGGGLWGVGFAIVDMRIRKLLKRYLATPMRRSHFLGSVMISRLIFTVPEVLFLLAFSRLAFGVTSQGGYGAVVLLILLGAFQFAGIGLLVASRAQTLETVSGLMNLVMLPMWLASGIFFSADRFPDAVQPLIALLPLTPLINAFRSVMLEGASLASLGSELLVIGGWGAVTFGLALRLFRWT